MSIVYLTHDEVNAAVATRIAHRVGLQLTVVGIKDTHPIAAGLLVYDLDHLPPERKSELLRRASGGELEGVAVHSYHLTPGESRRLRAAGVPVHRRLSAAILIPTA